MKKILIDIAPLKEKNQNAIIGIKAFLAKNKEDNLVVIGDSYETVTIHQNKRITIAQTDNDDIKIDPQFKSIKEKHLQILFTLLKRDGYQGFVSFDSIETLKPYIDKYFIKERSPLLCSTYANYKTHRITLLGDVGYNYDCSLKDYNNYLEELIDLAKIKFNNANPKFKFLSSNTKLDNEFIASVKDNPSFAGVISSKDIYKAESDIVLGSASTINNAINAIDGAISINKQLVQDNINSHVFYKIFSSMIKGCNSKFALELDQKLISGGMTLLGFNKTAIFVNPDVIPLGVKVALDNCAKL